MHITPLSSKQNLSTVPSCTSVSFSSATMHIISQSQYSIFQHCNHAHHPAVLSKEIFHQCTMHIISLSSGQHLSAVPSCTSPRCFNTASSHSANMPIISCPLYSIVHQCYQIISLQISTASFISATMHIISLS
mmetsp:Transcript_3988/g.6068  ORF Transcript_3988/g.6068 Transcript_3988/m.6068 type:complete len:133 (-) Transcript_3988:409-807(-)